MKILTAFRLSLCFVLWLLLLGCVGGGRPLVEPLAAALDVSEKAPGSLDFDVLDYRWTYLNDGAHIRLKGTVRNNTGSACQSVRLQAVLYDQAGRHLAQGDSYLAPTYLKAGAVGEFEIVATAGRKSGVTNTRLVSNCQTSAF